MHLPVWIPRPRVWRGLPYLSDLARRDPTRVDQLLHCLVRTSMNRLQRFCPRDHLAPQLQEPVSVALRDLGSVTATYCSAFPDRLPDGRVVAPVAPPTLEIGPKAGGIPGKQFRACSRNALCLSSCQSEDPAFASSGGSIDAPDNVQGSRPRGTTGLHAGAERFPNRDPLVFNNLSDQGS